MLKLTKILIFSSFLEFWHIDKIEHPIFVQFNGGMKK